MTNIRSIIGGLAVSSKSGLTPSLPIIKTTFRYYVHSDTDAQRIALSQITIGTNVPVGTRNEGLSAFVSERWGSNMTPYF